VLDPKPVHRSSVARKRRIERETYQKASAGDNRKGGPIRGRGKPCRGGRGSPGSSRCKRAGRRRRGRSSARIGWSALRAGSPGNRGCRLAVSSSTGRVGGSDRRRRESAGAIASTDVRRQGSRTPSRLPSGSGSASAGRLGGTRVAY